MPFDAQPTLSGAGAAAGFLGAAKLAHSFQHRPTRYGGDLRRELDEVLSPSITAFVEVVGTLWDCIG
jgi:hypothetical protein